MNTIDSIVCVCGVVTLQEANTKADERQELVDIYNNLSEPLKRQLLTFARIIETTRDIILNDGRRKEAK